MAKLSLETSKSLPQLVAAHAPLFANVYSHVAMGRTPDLHNFWKVSRHLVGKDGDQGYTVSMTAQMNEIIKDSEDTLDIELTLYLAIQYDANEPMLTVYPEIEFDISDRASLENSVKSKLKEWGITDPESESVAMEFLSQLSPIFKLLNGYQA